VGSPPFYFLLIKNSFCSPREAVRQQTGRNFSYIVLHILLHISCLNRVNISARERLDYSELEDVYLVLEEDGTEVMYLKGQ